MLAFNASNADRPHPDLPLAKAAVAAAERTLKEFAASPMLGCRVWTAIGKSNISLIVTQVWFISIQETGQLLSRLTRMQ